MTSDGDGTLFSDHVPGLLGHWKIESYLGDIEKDADGNIRNPLLETQEGDNLVVTNGKNLYLDRLFAMGGPPAAVSAIGVGTVNTAAAVGNTQMNQGGAGSSFLKAHDALATRSGLVVTSVTTFTTAEANFQWEELGMFNGTVNGTSLMLNRIAPIGPFNKTSSVSIVVTVTITAT